MLPGRPVWREPYSGPTSFQSFDHESFPASVDVNESSAIEIDDFDNPAGMLSPHAIAADHGSGKLWLGCLPGALAENAQRLGDAYQRSTRDFALLSVFEVSAARSSRENGHEQYRHN